MILRLNYTDTNITISEVEQLCDNDKRDFKVLEMLSMYLLPNTY